MFHSRLFRYNLILLVIGLITAPWYPVVAKTPDPDFSVRFTVAVTPQVGPIYVDADAPGPLYDGLSWTTAYTNLQAALITATNSSEIWVAEGIYMPGAAGDRTATFQPHWDAWDVALYGGFGGYGISETLRTQRDWVTHPTVLSGDLDHNDITTPGGVVTDTANITGTNAYHVVTGGWNSTIDGFIITAGQATGAYPHENGGGVLNDGVPGYTTLRNVILSGNMAHYNGGGIYGYGNLTLISVTVSSNQSYYGGGMYTYNGAPTLTNVAFTGNRASDGGGIFNRHNNLALLSVSFNDNEARFGGGMYNYASNATLTDVTFNENYVSEQGGGMVDREGGSTLTNVAFSNNRSDQYGGGIYFDWRNSSTLISVTLSGNQAVYEGGGIYNNYSSPTLVTVTLSNNQAYDGGGMYNDSGSPVLNNVTFDDNLANYGYGGGFYNGGSPVLDGVTFSNNQAGYDGGGMYNSYGVIDTSNLRNVVFNNNLAESGYGGGMYTAHGVALTGAIFSNNQARYGGGMYSSNQFYASTALTNVTFINNQTHYGGGGGIAVDGGSLTLFNVTFTGNSATGNSSDPGGGGMANNSSDPVLTNVIFDNNWTNTNGGAIYNSGSDPLLTNVTFSNNQASNGGGMYNNNYSSPTLLTVTFSSNQAGDGGAMLNSWSSNPTLTNVTFNNNRAIFAGGGMENLWDSNPTLTNVTLNGNSAYDGGGMRNFRSGPNFTNVVFSGNQSTGRGGGMINEEGSHPVLINTTFSGNQAGYFGGGGGIYNNDSNPTLVNCILWGNDASADPEIRNVGTSVPNITYSDVYWVSGVYTGSGNLNLDPQFVSPIAATVAPTTTGDYHLLPTSPVIDAGNNLSVTLGVDRDGKRRRMNVPGIADTGLGILPFVDLGAYEAEGVVVTLTLSTVGNGTLTSDPPRSTFDYGTVVTLTATPGVDSTFAGWSGALSSTTNPVTLTMDANKSITGTFALNTYTLTLNTVGNGTITNEPSGSTFAYGTVVTLTATPGTGSTFAGWSGDLNGTTNPITLTMNTDKSVTGTFTLNTHTLALNTIGNGTITSEPSGSTFAYGTVVTLTATPGADSTFAGWSGALGGTTNPITLTMDANKIVTGTFAINTYTLALNTIGNGTITSEPSGSTFAYGTVVTLTALPGMGSSFTGWRGDLGGTTNPITLTMDANKSITGTFTLNIYTLTLSTIGNGTITSEPLGSMFAHGTVVTLTALPGTGSIFTGWSGDLSGTTNPITLTMDADKNITGTFALNTYALTLNTVGNGTLTSEPSGSTFAYGTVVTLTATPDAGSTFAGWSGDLSGTTNPITLTMDANKIVTATFYWRVYLPLAIK